MTASSAQITCTKCHSVVPWGPYCPRCDAYLEFAGEPAWNPDGPPLIESEPTSEPIPEPTEAMFEVQHEPRPVSAAIPQPSPAVVTTATERTWPTTATWVVAFFVVIACTGATALMLVAGVPWGAAITALIGMMLLVVVCWPPREPESAPAPASPEPRDESFEPAADVEPDLTVPLVPVAPIVARAPQEVPPTATEATPVLDVRDAVGTVPCPVCGRGNAQGRAFCDWCGAVMEGAEVEPTTKAVSAADVAAEETVVQRRISRSWRVPIIVLMLVGVFATSVITALFGPQAFRVRVGITNIYQILAEFVNPYAGNVPRVVEVDASSSLAGTSPATLYGNDARTFWASASDWGYGVGTTITVRFDGPKEINRLVIYPGTQGTQFGVNALATPREMTLSFDDGTTETIEAEQVLFEGDFQQMLAFEPRVSESVTITIDSIYPPEGALDVDGFGEVGISALYFIEQPRPPQIITLPTAADPPRSFGWG